MSPDDATAADVMSDAASRRQPDVENDRDLLTAYATVTSPRWGPLDVVSMATTLVNKDVAFLPPVSIGLRCVYAW